MIDTVSSSAGRSAREGASALHDDALVWDMTLPFQPRYAGFALLDRYRASGVDFVSLTVNDFANPLAGTLLHLASVRQGIRDRSETLALAETVDDIEAAKAEGKLAVGFHFQETNPLEGSLGMIELYYQLGVRHMLLAYNQKNRVGDGCAEATDAALSRFGVSVVKEMNRVGMMVDGSHSGHRTTLHAMEVSSAPFVFSHANAHALHPHYRNIRDDQIKACAETNGVIGINGCGCFLGDTEASTEAIFRHVDYMVTWWARSTSGLPWTTRCPIRTGPGTRWIPTPGRRAKRASTPRMRAPSSSLSLRSACSTTDTARRTCATSWGATSSGWHRRCGDRVRAERLVYEDGKVRRPAQPPAVVMDGICGWSS